MAFITGMLLIDAPASALNNSGEEIFGARTDNTSSVKFIRSNDNKTYPYVSAQAVRFWLRNTLESSSEIKWRSSPIQREEKIAYTDGNPIVYWDDDLFGYMRAPSRRARKAAKDETSGQMTPLEEDNKGRPRPVTRVAPLRVSTFVSIAPVNITTDYGVMARHQGDPVPYEHQFYQATLQGLFSLDLNLAGRFYYRRRTGFQNLDSIRKELAEEKGLQHLENEFAYLLPQLERWERIDAVLRGMAILQGGAKQAVHYTDVSPAVIMCAVTQGGNHPFNYLIQEVRGEIQFRKEVLRQTIADLGDGLLSPIYIGWKPGYQSEIQKQVADLSTDKKLNIHLDSPRLAMQSLSSWLNNNLTQWDIQQVEQDDGA